MRKTGRVSVVSGMALALVGGLIPAYAGSQQVSNATVGQPPRPQSFPTLFPQPTNNNGYEEFVLAADRIVYNVKIGELNTDLQPNLALKRRVLNDPDVVEALRLVRAGLEKPVFSPRMTIDENSRFTEITYFRQLGRLLVIEQYVAFADGRVDAAINSLRTGLSFGYRIQTDSLINGLSGVSIEKMVMTEFSKHLDQLSAYQCDDVRRLVEDFLRAENPAGRMLAQERDMALRELEAKRTQPDGLVDWIDGLSGYDEAGKPTADMLAVQGYLQNHPTERNAMLDDARDRVNALYDQLLPNLHLPALQRKPFATDKAASPGAALARLIIADPQRIEDKYTGTQDQLRLIGVHALIHRYRWDHGVLPNSLADLRAPNMLKDAFTGSEVVYKREGDGYTITMQALAPNSAFSK